MGKSSSRFNDLPPDTMSDQQHQPDPEPQAGPGVRKTLSPAAQRALAEAEARRRAYAQAEDARPKEIGGRGGKEPVRYGDWEVKGLASDF